MKTHSLDPSKSAYSIGKQGDIQLEHPSCSRRHAQFTFGGVDFGDVYVTDVGSTHGTFVDGNKIPPMRCD